MTRSPSPPPVLVASTLPSPLSALCGGTRKSAPREKLRSCRASTISTSIRTCSGRMSSCSTAWRSTSKSACEARINSELVSWSGTIVTEPDRVAPLAPAGGAATPADFDVLRQAVEQLDIRPLQVLIEVLIVEARHDRSFSLGADFLVPPQSADKGDGSVDATSTGGGLGDLVIHLMNLGHADINATLRAAASKGDVQIVSRPVLLASNNTEARLLVGSQRPFVQVSRSLPTDTP